METKPATEAARAPIIRAVGSTTSERYLAKLADRTFLDLWCYPNVFIDKKTRGKGDGKELCDLLVVCGDHVLIFSDKTVAWPQGDDAQLAWRRWYRRAIKKSAEQIRGAERWINNFPNRVFLDRECTRPLPLHLPPRERRKTHGIVVALGAGEACKQFFGEGIGSLFILPAVQGDDHCREGGVMPFVIGDIDPCGSFIHVFDDATLDIIMRELDTVTDLTEYLTKKEKLVRSGKMLAATGEEELVAYYMTHMNTNGEHDFVKPGGSAIGENDQITFAANFYSELLTNQQYLAKKKADESSYIWDRLIEAFTKHMLDGTTIVPNGASSAVAALEPGIRHMALVSRFKRRTLGEAIIGALHQGKNADRFTRAMMPGPTDPDQHTGYFLMTLAPPTFILAGGYEQYRQARRNMLETYALTFLRRNPQLQRVVGIATEPPNAGSNGSSEDLVVAGPPAWTEGVLKDLDERQKIFNIAQPGNFIEYPVQGNEFPDIRSKTLDRSRGPNRHQRRAIAAQTRRSLR